MKRWAAAVVTLALAALLFMLTTPTEAPPERTVPEAIPIPTTPPATLTEPPVAEGQPARRLASFLNNGFIVGALPDGTRYSVRLDPVRSEEVTGASAAIMVELEDGAVPAGLVTYDLDGSVGENRGGIASLIFTFSGPTSVTVVLYEEVREALGARADQLFIDAFSGDIEGGYPVLRLDPPFRWATDYEGRVPMEVTFETFSIRRGCDQIAVACSSRGGVQVIPLDRLRSIAPVWDNPEVFVASQAPRPDWHPSYLPPGPLSARAFPDVLWTGEEMIVWGGFLQARSQRPLTSLVDGAAYNPETGVWRMLAPAPLPEGADNRAVWADGAMIVVSSEATLAYDPETDSWAEIAPGRFSAMFPGRYVWDGEAVYLWDEDLSRLDLTTGRWVDLPEPPLDANLAYLAKLGVLEGKLLVVGVSNECEVLELYLWDGTGWQALPPAPGIAGSFSVDCFSPNQVAVVGASILVWYGGFGSFAFTLSDGEWTYAGEPGLDPVERTSGGVTVGDQVLVPESDHGALYDPATGTWTRVLLPGWGNSWDMVWTGTEVLKWGMTPCCSADAPVDAWRWRPPDE